MARSATPAAMLELERVVAAHHVFMSDHPFPGLRHSQGGSGATVFHCCPLSTSYFAFAYSYLEASCIMIFNFLSDLEFSAIS